jgi:hypothetical protein
MARRRLRKKIARLIEPSLQHQLDEKESSDREEDDGGNDEDLPSVELRVVESSDEEEEEEDDDSDDDDPPTLLLPVGSSSDGEESIWMNTDLPGMNTDLPGKYAVHDTNYLQKAKQAPAKTWKYCLPTLPKGATKEDVVSAITDASRTNFDMETIKCWDTEKILKSEFKQQVL